MVALHAAKHSDMNKTAGLTEEEGRPGPGHYNKAAASKDRGVSSPSSSPTSSSSSSEQMFTVVFRGQELTSLASRRAAAVGAVFGGVLVVAMMLGSLLVRKVGLMDTDDAAPILVILHIACMSVATLVCSTLAVTGYAFVEPGAGNKPKVRKRHRTWNMVSAALMALGTVLILLHVALRHERVVRPRSIHMWLALAVGVGVTVQIAAGVLKYAALAAGRGVKRFTWHGEVGWAVYVGMLFTVNSGIVESDLFTGFTFLQMAMQLVLIGPVGLGAAHALGRLPAVRFDLDDPVAYVLREHLDASVPDVLVSWLTRRPTSCLRRCRPQRLAAGGVKHHDRLLAMEKARQWAIAVVIVLVLFVAWDVSYHWDDIWEDSIVEGPDVAAFVGSLPGHPVGPLGAADGTYDAGGDGANHLPGHPSRISIF